MADYPQPPVVAFSGQQWQYDTHVRLADQVASTVRAHIGRSTDRSTPQ